MESSMSTEAWGEAFALRQALVDQLKDCGFIQTPLLERAFREVPRHLFLPGVPLDKVYRDQAIITKRLGGIPASSSSEPGIMAVMLEQLGLEPGLYLGLDDRRPVDAEALYRSLTGPSRDRPTMVRATFREIFRGLVLWLALREPSLGCSPGAVGEWANRGIVPGLFFNSSERYCATWGLLEGANLCALMRPPDQPPSGSSLWLDPSPFDLLVRSFGPDDALAHRLIDQVIAWDAADRPSTKGLRIRAYPQDTHYVPSADEFVVPKRWTRLVVNWP